MDKLAQIKYVLDSGTSFVGQPAILRYFKISGLQKFLRWVLVLLVFARFSEPGIRSQKQGHMSVEQNPEQRMK